MLKSPQFLVGLAAGAAVAWWVARRRQSQLVVGAPTVPIRLSRRGRMGGGWSGPGKGAYR